jgi:hypothetical protein
MVLHSTGSKQWENGSSYDFNVRGLSQKWNPAINNDFTVFVRGSTRRDRNHIFLQDDICFISILYVSVQYFKILITMLNNIILFSNTNALNIHLLKHIHNGF